MAAAAVPGGVRTWDDNLGAGACWGFGDSGLAGERAASSVRISASRRPPPPPPKSRRPTTGRYASYPGKMMAGLMMLMLLDEHRMTGELNLRKNYRKNGGRSSKIMLHKILS